MSGPAELDEKAIRHDERKKIIAQGCIHTRKAAEQDGNGDRDDIRAWQEASSQWFDPTICEIVSEYAAWRDAQESAASATSGDQSFVVIGRVANRAVVVEHAIFRENHKEIYPGHAVGVVTDGCPLCHPQCPSSPFGRHQVDTSMESGPNNCFYCERPMPK